MENFESFIGEKFGPLTEKIPKEERDLFCEVIGWTDSESEPLVLLTRARFGEFELLEKMGIPLKKILHGEQEYELISTFDYSKPISYLTVIEKCTEKRSTSGRLVFIIFKTEFCNEGVSAPFATSRSTMILREAGAQK